MGPSASIDEFPSVKRPVALQLGMMDVRLPRPMIGRCCSHEKIRVLSFTLYLFNASVHSLEHGQVLPDLLTVEGNCTV